MEDLTGQKFGKLTAIEWRGDRGGRYLCRCDCGTEKEMYASALLRKSTKDKSCIDCAKMRRLIDISGQRFGKMTAISYAGRSRWLFRCDCGKWEVRRYHRNAGIKSCRDCNPHAPKLLLNGKKVRWTDYIGHKFGCLTLVRREKRGAGKQTSKLICECNVGMKLLSIR